MKQLILSVIGAAVAVSIVGAACIFLLWVRVETRLLQEPEPASVSCPPCDADRKVWEQRARGVER